MMDPSLSHLSIYLILFFFALCCAALFAYLETTFTSLRLFEVNQLETRIGHYKKLFATWRANPQRLLITILIASNFADVVCSVLITEIMQKMIGGELGLAVGVCFATLLILLFGNILPKSFARQKGTGPSAWALGLVNMMLKALSPIVRVCGWIAARFASQGGNEQASNVPVTEKEIEFLIDYSDQQGLIASDKSELLQNVFGLGQTTVDEVMIPRNDMVVLDAHTSLEKAQDLFLSCRYSRIPLYEKTPDNIIGFLYQKDLFALMHKNEKKELKDCMRPVVFVPETKRVNQLLREFLKTRRHMAIAIDEYGAVVGLVTLEDVLEEIVGEIRDEHEEVEHEIVPLENGQYMIDGRADLRDVEDLLGITLTTHETVTLGGFLTEQLQHVPGKGEKFFYKGFCFQVQQANLRKVQQVLVTPDGHK